MAYGDLTELQRLINEDPDETDLDDQLNELLTTASAIIDGKLRESVTIPLSTVPAEIDEAAKLIAAGLYYESKGYSSVGDSRGQRVDHQWKTMGMKIVDEYLVAVLTRGTTNATKYGIRRLLYPYQQ